MFSAKFQKNTSLRAKAEQAIAGFSDIFPAHERASPTAMKGTHGLRRGGAGEEFWQFHDYTSLNAAQDIDWRRSGKGDSLFTRQSERQSRQSAFFWCASSAGMNYRSRKDIATKAETAGIITLAFALLMRQAGESVRWLEAGRGIARGDPLETIERFLSDQTLSAALPAFSADFVPKNAIVILCGDFLEEPERLRSALEGLSQQKAKTYLIQILDPMEADLSCKGRVLFENPENDQEILIGNVDAARDLYLKNISTHNRALESFCLARGWQYRLYRTDDNLRIFLTDLWHEFQQRRSL